MKMMMRKPLKGFPIIEKKIKGHIYLYQITRAWRDKETGKVKKTERYLGAKNPVDREEHKQKQSEAKKGKASPLKGKPKKPHTDEAKRKMSAAKQGIPYDEWESFACEKKYCPKFNNACKESNREKYNRRCFLCNKTEKANGQKLSVHHVDMQKSQGCESNWKLVPLCKHCHATAHNDEIVARLGYILKR